MRLSNTTHGPGEPCTIVNPDLGGRIIFAGAGNGNWKSEAQPKMATAGSQHDPAAFINVRACPDADQAVAARPRRPVMSSPPSASKNIGSAAGRGTWVVEPNSV